MIRPLPPNPLDEEPLLRPLVVEEKEADSGGVGGVRQRPGAGAAATHHYSIKARSVLLRVHDEIICIRDEEEGGVGQDDEENGDDGRWLKAQSYVYGACGLRSFGHSTFWRFLGGLFKLVYAYYFFIWTIIYGGLALCFLISIVYEGWSTGDPFGTAAIVVSMLPVMNLLWVFFAFVLHALFIGVFWDFYDLESGLSAIRVRLQSLGARTCLTALVTFLVNGPILFSLLVFCVAAAKPVSDGVWRTQFFLSFICNVLLAFLFFTGALLGRDRPPPDPVQEAAAARREALADELRRRNASWCYRCVPTGLRRAFRRFCRSEAVGAVRVYVKASFQGGGVLTGGGAGSAWGRYAAEAFLPAPVDLEGTTALDEVYASSSGNGKDAAAAEELQRVVRVEGRGVKPWPSPWYLGWYVRHWCCRRPRSNRASSSSSSCLCGAADATQCCVALPWTLLLTALLLTLAIVAFSVKAYLLMGVVVVFFILLPFLYHLLARTIHSSFMGLLLVDVLLIGLFAGAFLLSLSVASYYLGFPVLLIILAANFLTLMSHVPAIRDQPYPSPKDHQQSLAFNAKRTTFRIITTARAWSWASIIILLVLVLMMKTVPANYTPADAAFLAATQLQHQRARMAKSWAAVGAIDDGVVVVGRNGSSLQQPPQPYAFCGQTFSRARLSVLDLAHVSNAAYMDMADAKEYIHQEVAGAARFNLTLLEMEESYGPITYLLDDTASRTLVLAIRGTNAVVDLFQDLDLYSEALVIQISTSLFPLYASPLFQSLLNKFVGTDYHLVEALTQLKDSLLNRPAQRQKDARTATTGAMPTVESRLYYKQLETYITEQILPDPRFADYQFLLTGHSLGGGVASIVGARLQALAVVFSSPGVVLSRRKFGLSLKSVSQYVVNIVPQGDLVPLIDVQGVKAQSIVCSANRLKYACHSILSTIGEIEQTCQQGRGWRAWLEGRYDGGGDADSGGDL